MRARIAVALCAAPMLLAGCAVNRWFATRTTVPDVERRVDAALPAGSTRQEIEAWLTRQGIEHSFSDLGFLTSSTGSFVPDPDYSGVVEGIIRDTDRTPLVSGSILLQFTLDKNSRLKQRYVTWIGTGP